MQSSGIRKLKWILMLTMILLTGINVMGQDITPIDIDREKPEQPRLHYYDKHGNKLPEPVLFIAEEDTIKKPSAASPWPVYNGMTYGVNIWDAAMLIAKQSYASFDLSAAVSIRNWFFPTVEAGIGFANNHSDLSPLTYRTKPSPFIKLGIDYNFLYKSTPDYRVCIGLRCGFSPVDYEITDITIDSGYWDQTEHFSILKQHTNAFYGEALASLKVKIWKAWSLGWSVRYHFNFHTPDGSGSTPWFIPGYGASAPLTATFSIFYDLGRKKKIEKEETQQ